MIGSFATADNTCPHCQFMLIPDAHYRLSILLRLDGDDAEAQEEMRRSNNLDEAGSGDSSAW